MSSMKNFLLLTLLFATPAFAISEGEHDSERSDSSQNEMDQVLRSAQAAPQDAHPDNYDNLEIKNGDMFTAPMQPWSEDSN